MYWMAHMKLSPTPFSRTPYVTLAKGKQRDSNEMLSLCPSYLLPSLFFLSSAHQQDEAIHPDSVLPRLELAGQPAGPINTRCNVHLVRESAQSMWHTGGVPVMGNQDGRQ